MTEDFILEDLILADGDQFLAASFFVLLVIAALLESLIPLRRNSRSLRQRWLGNFSLIILNSILLRGVLPVTTLMAALYVEARGWGLFGLISAPFWITIPAAVLLHDFVKYAQHVLFHYFPPFWRFHMIHHTDQDYDFTTGLRFHPLEALFTTGSSFLVLLLLGPPALAVVVIEFLTMTLNFLSHANVRLHAALERFLRLIFITPNLHRIHHSAWEVETNSNFAVIFSFWDRLFGTYRPRSRDPQHSMRVGLDEYREPSDLNIFHMLVQPFIRLKPRHSPSPAKGHEKHF